MLTSGQNKVFAKLTASILFVCSGQKEEASASNSVPINDLKVILSLAREKYLEMVDSSLTSAASCLPVEQESTAAKTSGKKKKKQASRKTVFLYPLRAKRMQSQWKFVSKIVECFFFLCRHNERPPIIHQYHTVCDNEMPPPK